MWEGIINMCLMSMSKGWTKKGSLEQNQNGAHLEDEEKEDLEIHGCRRLQRV